MIMKEINEKIEQRCIKLKKDFENAYLGKNENGIATKWTFGRFNNIEEAHEFINDNKFRYRMSEIFENGYVILQYENVV